MAYDRRMANQATAPRWVRVGSLPALVLFLSMSSLAGAMEQREIAPVFEPAEPPVQAAREPPRMAAGKSVDRIVQDIQKKYGAKVLKQEMVQDKERQVLRLQLYDEKKGRVWYVQVDAATGKELKD